MADLALIFSADQAETVTESVTEVVPRYAVYS